MLCWQLVTFVMSVFCICYAVSCITFVILLIVLLLLYTFRLPTLFDFLLLIVKGIKCIFDEIFCVKKYQYRMFLVVVFTEKQAHSNCNDTYTWTQIQSMCVKCFVCFHLIAHHSYRGLLTKLVIIKVTLTWSSASW